MKHFTLSHHSTIPAVFLIKTKTVFDDWNRYDSVPLDEDGRHLTAFITPRVSCRYSTAPHEYIVSGNGYFLGAGVIASHINNKTTCVDDSLLWAGNHTKNFFNTVDWLDICDRHGITFAGFEITNDSVQL